MDLVDLARIVLRRWYVAAGVLLVGLIVALVLSSSVSPKYLVEAQSILITGQSTTDAADEGPANPYLAFSGSLFTTLSAVTRTVDGQEYREQLDADGTSRDFLFTTSQEAPVIITESTASTPEEALELSEEVQGALAETLAALQSAEGVPDAEQIGIRVLTTSRPVQEMGDRNRVLFGVLGVTIAAAVGAAVLAESLLQSRRRDDEDDQSDVEPGGPGDDDDLESAGTQSEDVSAKDSSAATRSGPAAPSRPSSPAGAGRPTVTPRPTRVPGQRL